MGSLGNISRNGLKSELFYKMKNQTSKLKIVQEVKPMKRIGWISLINQKKLEKLRLDWRDLFDLNKYTLKQRFDELAKLGVVQRREIFENITPTVGFAALTKALSGNIATVAEVLVNYHSLGTGVAAPASGDTALGTEGARVIVSSKTYSGNKAYYTVFYGLTEGVGTWTEMGLWLNASATPGSGTLWDRSLISISKTNAQSLTIDYEDTLSNA